MDVASLGLRVESGEVDKGARSLDRLTAAAGKAERAADTLEATSRGAGAATRTVSSAADSAAAALMEESAAATRVGSALKAANQNTLRMGGSMSGLAAQLQDVGVTAAAGMNPMIIGLQQGTQIAGQMEMALANGGSAASVFGAAIKSLISPVSLLSIGLTVLLAAGLQMVDWAGVAQAALNGMADVLVTIAPYAVLAAAGLALLYAPAILSGLVTVVGSLGSVAGAVWGIATAIYATVGLPALLIAGFVALVAAAVIWRDDLTRILGVDVVGAVKDVANKIIGMFVGAYEATKEAWSHLPTFFSALGKEAWNNFISTFEKPALTVNGMTIIPGLDLSGMKAQLSDAEKASFGKSTVTFNGALDRDYIGGAIEGIKNTASGAADALRGMAAGLTGAGAAGDAAADGLKKTSDAADKVKDSVNESKGVVKGFLSDLRQGLMNGEGFWQSFGNAALNVLNKIIDKVEGQLVDALFSLGSGSGGGGNIFSTVLGWLGFARGGVFDHAGQVHAFARGGVVTRPTVFPFANGTGLMGEAGPEAIMPLRRGPDGRLGVSAHNQNNTQHVHVTVGVDVDDSGNILPFVKSVSQETVTQAAPAMISASVGQANKAAPGAMAKYQRQVQGGDYRTM